MINLGKVKTELEITAILQESGYYSIVLKLFGGEFKIHRAGEHWSLEKGGRLFLQIPGWEKCIVKSIGFCKFTSEVIEKIRNGIGVIYDENLKAIGELE